MTFLSHDIHTKVDQENTGYLPLFKAIKCIRFHNTRRQRVPNIYHPLTKESRMKIKRWMLLYKFETVTPCRAAKGFRAQKKWQNLKKKWKKWRKNDGFFLTKREKNKHFCNKENNLTEVWRQSISKQVWKIGSWKYHLKNL